jgi:hypothetical protein
MKHLRAALPLAFMLLLVACGGDSTSARPVIISFTASSTSIMAGESVTLSWVVSGVETISLIDLAGVTIPVTGSSQVVTPTVTTAYRLMATNQAGSTYQDLTVTVTEAAPNPPDEPSGPPPEIISFTATPSEIEPGEEVTLRWEVTGEDYVLVDFAEVPAGATSLTVSPTATERYSLYAFNAFGHTTSEVVVTVTESGSEPDPEPEPEPDPEPEPEPTPEPPVINSFTASSGTIDEGDTVRLRWDVDNADMLRISPDVGSVTGSSVVISPDETTTYTLTASNDDGSDKASVRVRVRDPEPPPPPEPEEPRLEYWVRSDCGRVFTTYATEGGGTAQREFGNGVVYKSDNFSSGDFVYISAQNQCGSGDVTVRIYKRGNIYRETSSSGAYVIATASGTY